MAKAPVTIEEKKKKTIPFAGKSPSSKPTPQVSIAGKPPVEPLPPVEIVEKSTIKLDRQIYSRSAFNNVIDTSFGELQKKEDTFSVAQFFQLYNALFFDIPRLGEESHVAIKRRSSEFLRGYTEEDPKDNTIDNLNDKILELEQQLLLASQTDPEHPFFRNGTLVAEEVNGQRTGKFFYMDKGFKRKVDYTDSFYRTLLKVLGYESSDDYPGASTNMLSQIKTGPNLGEGNFEQPTSIEEGELIIGNTVVDDTKDAEINRLRSEVRTLNQRIEDLQDLIDRANTGPVTQGGNNENLQFNSNNFGGQFGSSNNSFSGNPSFNNPFG